MLNVTPDSFSDGGAFLDPAAALAQAERLLAEGAAVIDVGGESSRPKGRAYGEGGQPVAAEEEQRRVLPVIEGLAARGARVSIDTVKPEVARAALRAGASIVNDVSCGKSRALLEAAAEADAELVLMHSRGRGECSGENVAYGDLVAEVCDELVAARERALAAGVRRAQIWLDPGIGFAKTARQSLTLLAHTDRLVALGQRVLVGASRKSFIGELARDGSGEVPPPSRRLGGTLAALTVAVLHGAHAIRVHDVAEAFQALSLAAQLREVRP